MHVLFIPAQQALLKGKDTSFDIREKSMDLLGNICKDHIVYIAFTDPWLDSMMCDKSDSMYETKKKLFDALVAHRIPLCAKFDKIAVRTKLTINPETDPRYAHYLEKEPKGTWIQVCTNGSRIEDKTSGGLYTNPHTVFITAAHGLSKAASDRINSIFYRYEEENQ